jgi:hypothetical protein
MPGYKDNEELLRFNVSTTRIEHQYIDSPNDVGTPSHCIAQRGRARQPVLLT